LKIEEIHIQSHRREELIDITSLLSDFVRRSSIRDGIIVVFVPHTTAAVAVNENADPDVARDILYKLGKEFPQKDSYLHGEGNSDAHIKSSLIGPSLPLIIADGKIVLGVWQAVYFCEFDGPRSRRIYVKAVSD
jgi:secondary thiamine-phosphate synthase enzyme